MTQAEPFGSDRYLFRCSKEDFLKDAGQRNTQPLRKLRVREGALGRLEIACRA
jgi:hypothetical protein